MKRITSLTYLHLLQLIKRYLKTKIRFMHLLHQITSKFELTSAAKSRIQWDTFYKKRPSSLSKISTNNRNHNTLITKFNCFIDKHFFCIKSYCYSRKMKHMSTNQKYFLNVHIVLSYPDVSILTIT